ncbi:hypothetical protein CISIN_1g0170171mg, partial [Citrus sinensis]
MARASFSSCGYKSLNSMA